MWKAFNKIMDIILAIVFIVDIFKLNNAFGEKETLSVLYYGLYCIIILLWWIIGDIRERFK